MNWMPHKIIGTTKTITAMKNIKHVSGKLWEVAVTNTKNSFNELSDINLDAIFDRR